MAYSHLLLLLGTILLTSMAFRSPRLYRKQSIAVMIGVLVPWAGNVAYLLDLGPVSKLDLTPFAFTITGITLTWALFRYQLLDEPLLKLCLSSRLPYLSAPRSKRSARGSESR